MLIQIIFSILIPLVSMAKPANQCIELSLECRLGEVCSRIDLELINRHPEDCLKRVCIPTICYAQLENLKQTESSVMPLPIDVDNVLASFNLFPAPSNQPNALGYRVYTTPERKNICSPSDFEALSLQIKGLISSINSPHGALHPLHKLNFIGCERTLD